MDFGGGDGYVGLDRRSCKPNLARVCRLVQSFTDGTRTS